MGPGQNSGRFALTVLGFVFYSCTTHNETCLSSEPLNTVGQGDGALQNWKALAVKET